MAFVPVPDTAQLEIRCAQFGVPAEWVLNFRTNTVIDQEGLDELTALVDGFVAEEFIPFWHASTFYRETYAKSLENIVDIESVNNDSSGFGTASGAAQPNQTSFAIKHTTGFTGRSARGRSYMFGMTAGMLFDGNTVTAAYADAMVGKFDDLRTAALAIGWTFVVVSRQSDNVPLTTGITRAVTESGYADLQIDTQRGRLA